MKSFVQLVCSKCGQLHSKFGDVQIVGSRLLCTDKWACQLRVVNELRAKRQMPALDKLPDYHR